MPNIFKLIVVYIRLQQIRVIVIAGFTLFLLRNAFVTSLSLRISDGVSERASGFAIVSNDPFITLRVCTG